MSASPRVIAFYGDDFTGATDTLATAARGGLRTMLFLRPPTAAQRLAAGALDCVGIAGSARAMGPQEMEVELRAVAACWAEINPALVHYKTCSTFDSAPQVGSIGLAVRILKKHLAVQSFVPIIGGQPNLGRYCLFGNLYAVQQAGGPAYRIDRHPTMRSHPVTPMDEADLSLHLAKQGLDPISVLQYPAFTQGVDDVTRRVDEALAEGAQAVLFDVGDESHLTHIGDVLHRALASAADARPVLAVGPSSVMQALLKRTSSVPEIAQEPAELSVAKGGVLVLCGSLSPMSAQQVAASASYERIELDAPALSAGDTAYLSNTATRVAELLNRGRHVLAVTGRPRAGDAPVSGATLAKACGRLLAQILAQATPRRIGLAGGDTSSYATQALDIWGLSYVQPLAPGVAICRTHAQDPRLDGIELMLKGGQMGSPDLFERFLGLTVLNA